MTLEELLLITKTNILFEIRSEDDCLIIRLVNEQDDFSKGAKLIPHTLKHYGHREVLRQSVCKDKLIITIENL